MEQDDPRTAPRESMEFDVVIVGAGPAGLSAAIRIKQIDPDLSVVVVEKGSEVGAHILSGAVMDPVAVDKLLPEWRNEDDHPFKTPVIDDEFIWMTEQSGVRLPNLLMPKLMSNPTATWRTPRPSCSTRRAKASSVNPAIS